MMKRKAKIVFKDNIQAFANKNFFNGEFDANYEDKSYWTIIDILRGIPAIRKIWDQDIATYGLTDTLKSLYTKLPIIVSERDVDEVIEGVENTLKINVADHLVVCPIPRAQFSRIIKLREIFILPQHFTEKQKIKAFHKVIKKDINELQRDVNHTIKSSVMSSIN